MATTTNYSWETPDDTDLVKDGAAAIRTLGSSIDTTTKALNPSTTLGDIEYRSATANTNTRLPIGTNGQVLSISGGVPAWATTADQTPLTTKGDIFTFTTVDARLGVGANGTVLTADSAEATGLKWATPSGGDDGPAFGVKRSGTQTVTAATWTVIQFNTEDFDTNSNFNTGTYKFTPTVAGYYQINLNIGGSGTYNTAMIAKNGSFTSMGGQEVASQSSVATVILYMNGTTDYVEAQGISQSTSIYADIYTTYFSGALIRKA